MSTQYQVELADVVDVPSDVLLLKHAGTFSAPTVRWLGS
jgi:hypothetical protein